MNDAADNLTPAGGEDSPPSSSWRASRINLLLNLLALLLFASYVVAWLAFGPGVPGSGQMADKPDAQDKQQDDELKPNFEVTRLATRPNAVETLETAIKPGHWTSATQEVIANNFDYQGELVVAPVPIPGVAVDQGSSRPALLPKAVLKPLELLLYIPPEYGANLTMRLNSPAGGSVLSTTQPVARLPEWQYYLVVLARDADRLRYLRNLPTLRPPSNALDDLDAVNFQLRLVAPPYNKPLPLATTASAWTNTAAVLWEDAEPATLTRDQQTALVDWLHWGGLLILSGPGTFDTLRGTFLEPYLPADSAGTLDLPPEKLARLNDTWTVAPARPLEPQAAWPVQKLAPRSGSRVLVTVDDTPLVLDRRVGRGRVVAVGFALGQRALTVWPDFDQLLSSAIFGRPPREFTFDADSQSVFVSWQLHEQRQRSLGVNDALLPTRTPLLGSNVRFATRDLGRKPAVRPPELQASSDMVLGTTNTAANSPGGWDDRSQFAEAARELLLRASGLNVPSARFVLVTLVTYAFFLVPVNWAVFRLLRRVEWAWIAAPLITIVAATAVIRLAQLNIGFARSMSEVAVLELQPNYPRAHVTRYTSLYTSLATRYAAAFDDPGAVVLPFPVRPDTESVGAGRNTVMLRRSPRASLNGFYVASNSLGMLHSEHWLELEGGIQLVDADGGWTVKNDSTLQLAAALLLVDSRVAWLGDLPAGAALEVRDEKLTDWGQVVEPLQTWLDNESPLTDSATTLRKLLAQLGRPALGVERRLIGFAQAAPPGMTIEPRAEQESRLTLVLANLGYAPLAEPQHDVVTLAQLVEQYDLQLELDARPKESDEAAEGGP